MNVLIAIHVALSVKRADECDMIILTHVGVSSLCRSVYRGDDDDILIVMHFPVPVVNWYSASMTALSRAIMSKDVSPEEQG